MPLPPLTGLNAYLLRPWVPVTKLDKVFGADGNENSAIRTRPQLESALVLVKEHLDAHRMLEAVAVGIVADTLSGGLLQVYAIEQQNERLRVQIQEVDPTDLTIKSTEPLIQTQPHLYFTWTGIVSFARLWFDTLTDE